MLVSGRVRIRIQVSCPKFPVHHIRGIPGVEPAADFIIRDCQKPLLFTQNLQPNSTGPQLLINQPVTGAGRLLGEKATREPVLSWLFLESSDP